jgi:hypothetical protein
MWLGPCNFVLRELLSCLAIFCFLAREVPPFDLAHLLMLAKRLKILLLLLLSPFIKSFRADLRGCHGILCLSHLNDTS